MEIYSNVKKSKIITLFCLILIFLLLDIFLFSRYSSWGFLLNQLFPYCSFLIIAECIISWSYWKFETLINPFAVYAVFVYSAGFSFLTLADKQMEYSSLLITVLVLSIALFILGGVIATYTRKLQLPKVIPSLSKNLTLTFLLCLFCMGIIMFVFEIRQLGYLPILNLSSMSVYDDLNENAVSPLHNFIVLNSVLPAMFFVMYKKRFISFFFFLCLAFLSSFILLNFFSRQMIILLFFSIILAVNYYHTISLGKLLIIAGISIVIFITLGELRSSSGEDASASSINEVIKTYTGINKPTNLLETYLSLYAGVNFTTADQLMSLADKNHFINWGAYTFRPILTVLPVNKFNIYPANYSAYTQLGTSIVDPYLDFRWSGVIFLNFLYGYLSMNSFKNYLAKVSPYYIVEWTLFMFCIFMCSFTNFFHMFFVFFFFIINRIAIK